MAALRRLRNGQSAGPGHLPAVPGPSEEAGTFLKMQQFYIRLWRLLDRYPLRVKTLAAVAATAVLAGLILWTLLAGTVAPSDASFFGKFLYFFEKFDGTHFVPFVILSGF